MSLKISFLGPREVALLPHVNIYEHFFACVPDIELNYLILLDQIAVIPQALIEEELLFHFGTIKSMIFPIPR